MHRFLRTLTLLGIPPLLAACFHTTVYTGIPGAGEVVSHPWSPSYFGGLIAPAAVEPAGTCKTGVYRVETSHSPGNVFVSILTLGIYTPLSIDVTCARAPRISAIPQRIP